MIKFIFKLMFLIETLIGIELFVIAIFRPIPIMGINAVLIVLGIILIFGGLDNLDNKKNNTGIKK